MKFNKKIDYHIIRISSLGKNIILATNSFNPFLSCTNNAFIHLLSKK